MESLSIWSLAAVVLNSAVIMAVRLSTQRVWHTFNYDVTVSNGVNLCHPVMARLGVRDFEIHWISRGFRISEWISGFQSGFLDFI